MKKIPILQSVSGKGQGPGFLFSVTAFMEIHRAEGLCSPRRMGSYNKDAHILFVFLQMLFILGAGRKQTAFSV